MPSDDAPDPSGETSTGIEQGGSNALITVHVKSLRGEDFEMTVPRDVQVSDLKTRVRERTGVEEARQRLIYRGKLLVDADTLSTYKVEDGHCLHLVVRPLGTQVAQATSPSASASSVAGMGSLPAATMAPAAGATGNENSNQTASEDTNTANTRTGTLGQRLLMGMGVPLERGGSAAAGGAVHGGGSGGGVDTALLNAAAGLDGGQLLSNVLGLAGAGAAMGSGAAAGGAPGNAGPGWNSVEGRAARAQGREAGAGHGTRGVGGGGGGGEDRDEESQADLEHVRQGLLTLHTLLSGTNRRIEAREARGTSPSDGARASRAGSPLPPRVGVSRQSSPLSTASPTSVRSFLGGASRTPSPTQRSPRVGKSSTDGDVQSAPVAELLPAASGKEGQAKEHPGAAMPSPEKLEETEGQGQKGPAAGEGAETEGNGALTVPPSLATTPTVTQRWPYARAISRAPERSRGSRSGSDSSSNSPGVLVSSGDSGSDGSEDDGAPCLSNRSRRSAVSSDERNERGVTHPPTEEEEKQDDSAAARSGGDRSAAPRKFYVGQWLDVKDTVNNWLEATVMDMTDSGTRLQIHYNGWPPRWDEWLSWDSPRIAPFRTRTQHLPHSQHVSPAPISAVRNAPITGMDDIRVVMPQVTRVMQEIGPMVEELSASYARDLENDPCSSPTGERTLSHTLPWTRQRVQRSRPEQDDASRGASPAVGTSRADEVCTKTAELAADVAPLLDRLGRMLTDVAPHLARLGSRPAEQSTADSDATADGENGEEPGEVRRGPVLGRRGVLRGTGGRRTRSTAQSGRARSRSPEDRTAAAFRQLVSTSSPAPTSSNINIHIHAIVPLRAPPSPPPPPPPPPTAAASAVATPTRADRPPLAVGGSRGQPWGSGMDAVGASASLLAAARAAAASRAGRDSETPEGGTPRSLSRGILADSPRSTGRTGVGAGDDVVALASAGTPRATGISRSASVASSGSFDVAMVGTPHGGASAEERAEVALHGIPTPEASAGVNGELDGSRSMMAMSGTMAPIPASGDPDGFGTGSEQSLSSDSSASSQGSAGQRRPGGWRSILRTFGVGGNGNSRVGGRREGADGDMAP